MPPHYKLLDTLKLFSSYGKPMHIGMYYRDHPKRKIWTQEGYVLFEAADDQDGPRSAGYSQHCRSTNNIKDTSKAHPANHTQQKDAEGFQPVERKKRTSKKRAITNKTTATHMVGVEPTSPAVPATQAATVAQAAPEGSSRDPLQDIIYRPLQQMTPPTATATANLPTHHQFPISRNGLSDNVQRLTIISPDEVVSRYNDRINNYMLKSIKVATLNARTINKISNPKASKNYHKFLSTQKIKILALQETNIAHKVTTPSDTSAPPYVHMLVSGLQIVHLCSDGRAIFAEVGSVDTEDKVLFEVCAIYAPFGDPRARTTFFNNPLQEPFFDTPGSGVIVMGDFNYHHYMRNSAPAP
ncbi:hypothetical protein EC957_009051 [Mortierella hygrophila]|uniref:Endonuclease/exonuclease/phosphatase domain-containing protein n=1 Tax=Mortierella hygrophila TaxID=979708 RepID=A0A9P6EX41_9FUNG|nr:hypothetical protein EC957_009051 [Mortierella hygrophila]